MRYQALYRKYRPQRFSEIVGQDHVVDTLLREINDDKVAHAYLFTGPRGTGKTTTARLLAKSLNCTNRGPDGEPDNECASCLAITEAHSIDVIELDAASHNKVEDIREIRINVGTVAAAAGARRVYILDEAHMLSRAAGNALLKTLEEPPEHAIFVLATTEPYKLLDTIRSRAQRFDFHPVPAETMISHLKEIAAKEDIEAQPDGLAMIATHARGSVRDALSLLEQVAALGNGTVAAEGITRALGLADRDAFTGLAAAIANQDAPAALGMVAELSSRGADLRRFVADALGFFRGVFLAQYAPNLEEITDEPVDVIAEWRKTAGELSATDVLRAIDQLSEALLELRAGREERLVLELTLLRLTRPETAVDTGALVSRVERLEQGASRKQPVVSDQLPVSSLESRVASPEQEPTPSQPEQPGAAVGGGQTGNDAQQELVTQGTDPEPSDPPPGLAAGLPPEGGAKKDGAAGPAGDGGAKKESVASPSGGGGSGEAADGGGQASLDEPSEFPTKTDDDSSTVDEPSDPPPGLAAGLPPEGGAKIADVTLGEFQAAWPAIVARIRTQFGARRHAFVKVAEPMSVDNGVAVLTLPSHQHFHLEQLNADRELLAALSDIAAELLGGSIALEFRADDSPDQPTEDEPERAPDKDRLIEEGSPRDDPADLIADMLGGEVVSE